MPPDPEWLSLIETARRRGWLKFCHDGIAVLERPPDGGQEIQVAGDTPPGGPGLPLIPRQEGRGGHRSLEGTL